MPSQSNQILTTSLRDFIAHIKVSHAIAYTLDEMPDSIQDSDGISDGADKYPG